MSWREDLEAVAPAFAPAGVGRPLPSRDALHHAIVDLRAAWFADLLGHDQPVPALLLSAVEALERELAAEPGFGPGDVARTLTTFVRAMPELRATAFTDLDAAVDGDPAAHDRAEVLACYPGFRAIFQHRVAHVLHGEGAVLVARSLAADTHACTAIDLHPGARIGPRFFIDHGTGVVIGATAVVGANVRLYQGVTLGAKSFPTDAAGNLIRGALRHPILEDDVTVYAGATILGRITIGRGSVIGGGVWLTRSVPPDSRILQAAARAEAFEGGAGI